MIDGRGNYGIGTAKLRSGRLDMDGEETEGQNRIGARCCGKLKLASADERVEIVIVKRVDAFDVN